MEIDIKTAFSTLMGFLFILAGIIYLQIILSKRENKWFGLILPVLSFLNSIAMTLGIRPYKAAEAAKAVEESIETVPFVVSFLINNIPTLILAAIYLGIREKKKIQSQIDDMKTKKFEDL